MDVLTGQRRGCAPQELTIWWLSNPGKIQDTIGYIQQDKRFHGTINGWCFSVPSRQDESQFGKSSRQTALCWFHGKVKQGMSIQIEIESPMWEYCMCYLIFWLGLGFVHVLGLSLKDQCCYMISVQIQKKSCDCLPWLIQLLESHWSFLKLILSIKLNFQSGESTIQRGYPATWQAPKHCLICNMIASTNS